MTPRAVAPVRELARAELDVADGIHHLFPRDAANVAVRATFLVVEDAADRHQPAVLRVDLAVAGVRARRLLVHVAFVHHDREQQRRAEIVTLRRGRGPRRRSSGTATASRPRVCQRIRSLIGQIVFARQVAASGVSVSTDGVGAERAAGGAADLAWAFPAATLPRAAAPRQRSFRKSAVTVVAPFFFRCRVVNSASGYLPARMLCVGTGKICSAWRVKARVLSSFCAARKL